MGCYYYLNMFTDLHVMVTYAMRQFVRTQAFVRTNKKGKRVTESDVVREALQKYIDEFNQKNTES